MAARSGQYLRENEWLMNIRSRAAIPAVCEFDLPSYHHWLNRNVEAAPARPDGLDPAAAPIRDGLEIVLRLLARQRTA